MPAPSGITTLFLDIGGVLLTNGWDHTSRHRAAETFGLDWEAMEARHQAHVDAYEKGRLSLDDYLTQVIFNEPRAFSRESFWQFMCAQSQPDPGMLALFPRLKQRHGLKLVAVSNEAKELNAYRIETFGLDRLFDIFISSSFVHVRKPDIDIFKIALEVSMTRPEQVFYVDNTGEYVDLAAGLGIRGLTHTDLASTENALATVGLVAE
ncbi:HAD hydrolase-like protein [Kaistia defluvii]|uniref:HAD family hydrolase n=1 Tax=Kaistia defluvii TaxID=410841 RepID=UPI002255FCC0|nr:HAD family hydrolase [Kaistia defluvii]MCX5518329.1 HAD hydrolase-like protein [Kaistia defluvii]